MRMPSIASWSHSLYRFHGDVQCNPMPQTSAFSAGCVQWIVCACYIAWVQTSMLHPPRTGERHVYEAHKALLQQSSLQALRAEHDRSCYSHR